MRHCLTWSKTRMISSQKGNLCRLKQRSLETTGNGRQLSPTRIWLAKMRLVHFHLLAWLNIKSFFVSVCFLLFFLSSYEKCLTIPVLVLRRWKHDSSENMPALSQSRHAGTHDLITPCHLTSLQVAEICISWMSFNNWGAKAVKNQALPNHPLLCKIKS